MARVNVYVPDDLAEQARLAGLNVSTLTQAALRRELARFHADEWITRVSRLASVEIAHDEVLAALDVGRDEFGHRGD